MPRKTKVVTMELAVTVPKWMTVAQARREVRTLINEQCGYLSHGPDYDDATIRVKSVGPLSVRCTCR